MSYQEKQQLNLPQITRIGVYGILMQDETMLLIRQRKGPYAGKLDFPGGGVEFGEFPEQALLREFKEEIGMEFTTLELVDNITAVLEIPASELKQPYTFFHVGMLYRVEECRPINNLSAVEFELIWKDLKTLSEDECSSLLWKYILKTRNAAYNNEKKLS